MGFKDILDVAKKIKEAKKIAEANSKIMLSEKGYTEEQIKEILQIMKDSAQKAMM